VAIALKNLKLFPVIALALFLCCGRVDYNPKLVDYLKAERELRKRINQNQGLEDSLSILQKNLKIDVKKELKKIEKNPEAWIKLFKEIDGEK